ncbi:MAG: hypothetical protein QX203_18920, partial [Methylococcaceae bacterium]
GMSAILKGMWTIFTITCRDSGSETWGQALRYPHEFSKLVVPAGMPEPSAMDGNVVTFQVLNKSGLPFKVSHSCDWMLASLPA